MKPRDRRQSAITRWQHWTSTLCTRWGLLALVLFCIICIGGIAVAAVLAQQRSEPTLALHTLVDVPLPGGTSRFDYESLDPQTHQLFIAHLGASQVTVFDTRSNRVIGTISQLAGVHGVLAVPALGRVYASATDDNQIAVIDERSLQVVARIPGGDYPDGLAYDPVEQTLFVSDEAGQTDTVIDTRTDQRITTIALGGEAGNTQYDPGAKRIFVDVQTRNQLAEIDPTTNQVVARAPLPGCQHDHSLLIDAPHRLAFIACDGNATLLVMDLTVMRISATAQVGTDPDVLAWDAGRRLLYVASESGVVSVFADDGPRVRKVGEGFVAAEAHSIAVDEQTHRLYLPLQDLGGRAVLRIAEFPTP